MVGNQFMESLLLLRAFPHFKLHLRIRLMLNKKRSHWFLNSKVKDMTPLVFIGHRMDRWGF